MYINYSSYWLANEKKKKEVRDSVICNTESDRIQTVVFHKDPYVTY